MHSLPFWKVCIFEGALVFLNSDCIAQGSVQNGLSWVVLWWNSPLLHPCAPLHTLATVSSVGRLLDFVEATIVNLNRATYVVLDEVCGHGDHESCGAQSVYKS